MPFFSHVSSNAMLGQVIAATGEVASPPHEADVILRDGPFPAPDCLHHEEQGRERDAGAAGQNEQVEDKVQVGDLLGDVEESAYGVAYAP